MCFNPNLLNGLLQYVKILWNDFFILSQLIQLHHIFHVKTILAAATSAEKNPL